MVFAFTQKSPVAAVVGIIKRFCLLLLPFVEMPVLLYFLLLQADLAFGCDS
jgi:hypothetical protein